MIKTPLFSIIIPLYNKEQYLGACLKSVQDQSEHSWECLIINDGSTDDSESVARKFEKQDGRFKVLNQKNSGPSVARNYGIKESKGKLIHFLDADDYYPSLNTLESIGTIYTKENPMAISGNILIFHSADGSTHDNVEVNSKSNELKYQTFAELQNDYFFTRFFFDRKFIEDHKVTFPEYTYVGEDPVFLVKALSQMDKFLVTNVPVYTYRQVAGSSSELYRYDEVKLISYMTTQLELLEICEKNQYTKLKKRILDRIDRETIDLYMQYKDQNSKVRDGLKNVLTFIDVETHHERILNVREKEAHIHNLEKIAIDLRTEIESLKHPGVKIAARTLLGALKRKAKNIYKTIGKKA